MEEYVSVRVSTLRGDQAIPFKVYLKIGSRHILYVRQGDAIDGDRLKKIKDKKLKRMYILPQDETSYRDYISKNIEMAYNSDSGMATESRAHIVQGHQQSQAEEVMEIQKCQESGHQLRFRCREGKGPENKDQGSQDRDGQSARQPAVSQAQFPDTSTSRHRNS